MYEKTHLNLNANQFHKLLSGMPVQLSKHQLSQKAEHWLMLHPETSKKVHKARRARKGVRIHVSPHEMHISEQAGSGFFDFFRNIGKKIGGLYKRIKPTVAPLLRSGVESLYDYGKNAAELAAPEFTPEIESLSNRYRKSAIDQLGKTTGAYGLRSNAGRRKKPSAAVMEALNYVNHRGDHQFELSDNWSHLLSPQHPAMNPGYPLRPSGGRLRRAPRRLRGGSFLPA